VLRAHVQRFGKKKTLKKKKKKKKGRRSFFCVQSPLGASRPLPFSARA
jgi:hypothetical protein